MKRISTFVGQILLWMGVSGLVVGILSLDQMTSAHGTGDRSARANLRQNTSTNAKIPQPQQFAQIPYEPTPYPVIEAMLELAKVTKDDVVYDLGSGDGRIVITAAQKLGARGVGIDLDPKLIQESQENAQKAGVSDRARFVRQDLFKTDLSQATVVTLYLLPQINLKLRPILLRKLKPGTRIVSHQYNMGDWKPDQVVQIDAPDRPHTLYYWVVPKEIPDNLR